MIDIGSCAMGRPELRATRSVGEPEVLIYLNPSHRLGLYPLLPQA